MKILITGGAGFIGSNLIELLLRDRSNQITCIDNFDKLYDPKIKRRNISSFRNDPNYIFNEIDIRDKNLENRLTGEYDAIVHLAAKAGVRSSILDPLEYADVNISGTINMLEFAVKKKIRRFIFGSSSSVYGNNPKQPWKESDELMPISPYAASKCAAEKYGYVYTQLHKIQFIGLRFFTVYGARQRPDLAINKFFQAITHGLPIDLYGDGTSIRDYTHVSDIVNAISQSLTAELPTYTIMNVSSSNPVKLIDLVKEINNIVDKKADIRYLPDQPGDVDSTFGDISLARKYLGYNPSVSLSDGLRAYFTYLKTI